MEIARETIGIILSGLPDEARWMIDGTPLDFEFTASRLGLCRLPDNLVGGSDPTWSELLVFGEDDFAEGGGASAWLCVHEGDGSVCRVDPHRENSIVPLNSSVEQFVATFRFLNDYLAASEPLPHDCDSRLRAIDPDTYPKSEWRLLVEYLRSGEPGAGPTG